MYGRINGIKIQQNVFTTASILILEVYKKVPPESFMSYCIKYFVQKSFQYENPISRWLLIVHLKDVDGNVLCMLVTLVSQVSKAVFHTMSESQLIFQLRNLLYKKFITVSPQNSENMFKIWHMLQKFFIPIFKKSYRINL